MARGEHRRTWRREKVKEIKICENKTRKKLGGINNVSNVYIHISGKPDTEYTNINGISYFQSVAAATARGNNNYNYHNCTLLKNVDKISI